MLFNLLYLNNINFIHRTRRFSTPKYESKEEIIIQQMKAYRSAIQNIVTEYMK